ncbi:MAG: LysM peptidoglycan-binding domain-containing protein [Dehalococcoidia bacterium]|nr:LysM peptidoglycan-binding domain-containing protein [Dehalococcoidia bacterium]
MEPAAIMPSSAVFHGTAVLFAVSLMMAVWHLVAWPQFPSPEPLALAPLATRTPYALISPPVATSTPRTAGSATPARTTTAGSPAAGETPVPTASAAASPVPTATAAPTQTPAPTATPRPGRRYIVESGDTLLSIAFQFGTTLGAITAANGITEDALLQIGQELVIP